MQYLERVVVGQRQSKVPEIFRKASPLANVEAPFASPQIVVHGTQDWLISVHEARKFAELYGAEYVEIQNGVHGFDLIDAGQCQASHQAIVDFLERVRTEPVAA
jgi:pimeloyl-ACP methyl ester carboxylesterase